MKQEEIKNKMIKSCLKNGGFNHKNFFRYNDLIFESSWELYFYLYLLKNNISFIYKPEPLIYIDSNNKSHYYFPDFKTSEYIEIKGDNLITENGILKDFNGNLQEDKTNFLKSLGVKILSGKELEPIFKEIDAYYGKDFVKSHKV